MKKWVDDTAGGGRGGRKTRATAGAPSLAAIAAAADQLSDAGGALLGWIVRCKVALAMEY